MDFLMIFLKIADWIVYQLLANSCYKAAMKVKNHGFFLLRNQASHKSPTHQLPLFPTFTKCCFNKDQETLVCDIQNTLLLDSKSFFPYFMLVAFEGGSMIRALILLLSYPLLLVLDHGLGLRLMIFVTFCGLKLKDVKNVGRGVLPKFYLENLNLQVHELIASSRSYGIKVLVFTRVPRVMVEGFCKEYLSVDDVIGTELHGVGGYFSGFVTNSGVLVKHKAVKEWFGNDGNKPDIGVGGCGFHDQLFISQCKEGYVVNKEDAKRSSRTITPREKYPKPLVFHDGRLAFFPTPLATLCMFVWFPLGILLAITRLCVGIYLPYPLSRMVGGLTGVNITIDGCDYSWENKNKRTGVLFVCTHRTLLDPIFLTMTVGKSMTAVTYSLSKMSEVIAPIKTVRLTRDRKQDGETMHKLLSEGDLIVCPEGTTCREPYLLRFSSLFAELTDDIVPVAMNTHVTMFYGTTASGLKCLDPIFFLMNPRPSYHVKVLGKLAKELTCGVGGKSSHDVANHIQKKLADALGFECTNLTRRDKYLMLAGNQGIVEDHGKSKKCPS